MVFNIIFFCLIFVVIFAGYYFIFDDMLKKEKYTKISELVLLTKKFKLDKKKMNYRNALTGIALINAFIIAFTATLVQALSINIVFTLLIAFVVIMILIFSLYFAYGKYLNKKWGEK